MARVHEGRTELRKAALKRKADAWALWRAGRQHARGAAYLGGYAIECKLKAIAMEAGGCWTLTELMDRLKLDERDVYTHGLEILARSALPAGFYPRLRAGPVWRDFVGVNAWRPSWRYDHRDWSPEKAKAFLDAVEEVYAWLESNRA